MRKVSLILAATAVIGLALAGVADAAQRTKPGTFFDRIDLNRDGAITRVEAFAAQSRRFERLDADNNGAISLEEFQAIAERRFERHDLDGDGQVTREEIAQARRAHGAPKSAEPKPE